MKRTLKIATLTAVTLFGRFKSAQAVEFEPLKQALLGVLGTPKVMRKTLANSGAEASTLFYAKDDSGKVSRAAFIEKGLYEPDCTHTWVIGIEPSSGKVTDVRTVEMKCQHAFPCQKASFLEWYQGKGPADVQKLSPGVHVVAKATGTADLTTAAVKRAITHWQSTQGSL